MIKIKNSEGKEFILEYDRESIGYLEKIGFSLDEYSKKPATMMPLLFRGAFYKNHKFVRQSEIDDIYKNISKKTELMNRLVSMLADSYDDLVENKEGNLDWEEV